jgi:hypothetical protein
VTDQALYVTGDYNRAANVGDLPKQPAALIGDSINILSNNYWRTNCTVNCAVNDAQSVANFGSASKDAATVRINAAFLAGVDETGPGQFAGSYNGGLENYVRFHEDWSDPVPQPAMNYSGSLVSLGKPVHANGSWVYGDPVYTAPLRNWDYDAAFNNAANLPPLTPRFVYVQQVLFTEDFQ